MLESTFQRKLIKDITSLFPGCIILKNDPNFLQGFPDLLILFEDRWAVLEVKITWDAAIQANQEYYINLVNKMGSFGAFVYPENREEVLVELQRAFDIEGPTRIPQWE